ncbi:MAG: diacylglycerol/lipid kinase family protein [Acidimicrobiia bacterium]
MISTFGPMRVIVNPKAGRGMVMKSWPAARRVLDQSGIDYRPTLTEGPGHAMEAARAAVEQGERFVVAVGGDGTVSEVVNGLMEAAGEPGEGAVLGVVAAGSGCDFARTFDLPADAAGAAARLLDDRLWGTLDVGRVSFTATDGTARSRWFVNIAEVGLGADSLRTAIRLPRWLGPAVYRLAAAREIARHRPWQAVIELRGLAAAGNHPRELVLDGPLSILVVANCRYFGGGLMVAPEAGPGDGLFDVQVAVATRPEALRLMQKMATGSHVPSDRIKEFRAASITLDGPVSMAVEADGESLGVTPATFEVVPGALRLKV